MGRKTGRREGAAYDRSFGQHNAPRAAGRARTGPPPGGGRGCDGGAHRRGARPRAPFAVPARRPALVPGRPLLAGRVPARIDAWLGAGCQARPRAGPGGLDGAGGVEAGCLRSRAAGQPAPPAGIRAGCLHPRQRRGRARGHRPGPPRARPCRPSPPAGPGRPPAPPRRAARPRGLSSLPRSPGRPPRAAAGRRVPAGAGLDAAGGAERPSSRTHGRAAPGNANRSRPAPRHPGRSPRNPGRPAADDRGGDRRAAGIPGRLLPLAPAGAGPPAVRLPGGGVRVRRSALTAVAAPPGRKDTQDGQEQGADGQLRRQVLGHQEARQRPRGTVPGPVGRGRARALQVVQGPPPRRRVPRRPQGRGPRPAALRPAHRPARGRDDRGRDGDLVPARPHLRRGQVARASPRSRAGRSPRRWSP